VKSRGVGGLGAGMRAFFSKPFTDDDLRAALAEGLPAKAGT